MGRTEVSAIIIFYNAEKFLREAVESVLAQTLEDWELLLVDDGSSDGSSEIAKEYAEQENKRVRYLQHEGHQNLGMSAARNLGIRQARGRYLAFLDADDVWTSQALEQQFAILESQPDAGMVYGPIRYWFSWSGKAEDQRRDYIEALGVPGNRLVQQPALVPLFLEDLAAVPSGIMVRRQVIDEVGGFEDAFRGEYEDQAFCVKVCLNTPVYAAGNCWYSYRQHPDSSVSQGQRTGETYSRRLFFLNWLRAYLTEQKIKDRRVWGALQRELWAYHHPALYRWSKRWQRYIKRTSKRFSMTANL